MVSNVNNNDLRDRYSNLIRIALVILLVQNGILVIPLGLVIYIYILPIFPIDLIGFLLLAGGYLLYSTQEVEYKRYYFLGGLCILGWAICRVLYQYIIPFMFMPYVVKICPWAKNWLGYWVFIHFFLGVKCPGLPLWATAMIISIFIGGIALTLGSIVIWRTQKENWGHRLFMVYGVCNAIVISLFVVTGFPRMSTFGSNFGLCMTLYLLKGFVVPLLGVIAFYPMCKGSKSTFLPITAQLEGQDDLAGISSDHVEAGEEEETSCPTCGQTIPIISRHCPYCGVGLEND
ncbi:MAG: hypothetical protein ACFFCZ_13555 [Promethearchaeota archaeon]